MSELQERVLAFGGAAVLLVGAVLIPGLPLGGAGLLLVGSLVCFLLGVLGRRAQEVKVLGIAVTVADAAETRVEQIRHHERTIEDDVTSVTETVTRAQPGLAMGTVAAHDAIVVTNPPSPTLADRAEAMRQAATLEDLGERIVDYVAAALCEKG